MSHVLEPAEKLRTPEYWGGVDISNDAVFAVPAVDAAHISSREQLAADDVLASCLAEVYRSDFVETAYKAQEEFAPSEQELGDGTVLILDSEHLSRWTYPKEDTRQWSADEPTDTRLPVKDFCDYWRSCQPVSVENGEERALFPEDKMIYTRLLNWGVLLTHEGERMISAWALGAARVDNNSLSLPVRHDARIFRGAETVPIPYRQTVAKPDLDLGTCAIRNMSRLRGVKIVHAATADYELQEESKKKISQRLRDAPGSVALPKPDMEPSQKLYPI